MEIAGIARYFFAMTEITKHYTAVIDSPVSRIGISETQDKLSGIDYLSGGVRLKKPQTALSKAVIDQLNRYFESSSFRFDIPLALDGTPFQQRVWSALQDITPGDTRTYGDIAQDIASGARAVGNACRRNPVPIIVPCHRVVATGHLGGYAGQVSGKVHDRKRWLLAHEGLKSLK